MNDTGSPFDLARLIESAAAVASQAELRDVLTTTVAKAMVLTEARYGALGVIGANGKLDDFVHRGFDEATVAAIGHYPEGRGILGVITKAGTPIRVSRIVDHPDAVGFPPGHPSMETFLGVPIRVGERIFGNLYLTDKSGGFTESDQAVTESLAVIAGSAIVNARTSERLLRAALVEDRARIARDLHDAIIQELYAVGLSLQGMGNRLEGEDRRVLEGAVDQLDTSIAALRRFIFDLRPPLWVRRQFRREIDDLVREMSMAYGARVDLDMAGSFDEVSDITTETASLVVREALSNALRHSRGTVRVEVQDSDGYVEISVVDNGIGFDPSHVRRGMGLDNIQQRVSQRGGVVEFKTAPGSGTMVVLRLPS